jgi:hypothetical protein
MQGLALAGSLLVWPLRTGANSPTGIILTIALVVLVNLVIYVAKKAWQMMSEDGS